MSCACRTCSAYYFLLFTTCLPFIRTFKVYSKKNLVPNTIECLMTWTSILFYCHTLAVDRYHSIIGSYVLKYIRLSISPPNCLLIDGTTLFLSLFFCILSIDNDFSSSVNEGILGSWCTLKNSNKEEIQFCRVYQSHYSFILCKLNLSLLWYGNIIININSVQFFFSKTFSFIFNTFNYRRKVYRNKKNKHLQVWYKCHNVKSKDKLWKAKTISTWL